VNQAAQHEPKDADAKQHESRRLGDDVDVGPKPEVRNEAAAARQVESRSLWRPPKVGGTSRIRVISGFGEHFDEARRADPGRHSIPPGIACQDDGEEFAW
jgi:hypothetical protein